MKHVSDYYTLKSLAEAMKYGGEHGKFLDYYLRYHTKFHDYFVTNCNMSSDVWLVIVVSRPYFGFPTAGRRLVILGSWHNVYNYLLRVPAPPGSGDDDCPF